MLLICFSYLLETGIVRADSSNMHLRDASMLSEKN